MRTEYPSITFKEIYPLLAFMLEVKKNPSILDSSPYDGVTKNALKELFSNKEERVGPTKSLNEIDIEEETIRLYESMKNIEMGGEIDAREKIALMKLQATSLKDLLDMLKESKQIKNIKIFEDTILEILTDEQKQKVISLIK